MNDFEKAFEAYGADYTATMARFMGRQALYLKLMGMLFQDKNLQTLGSALEEKNLDVAFEAAHALKGVAGNMGLTPLYQAIDAIVQPLRKRQQRDDYMDLYGAIQTEFQRAEHFYACLNNGEQL